MRGTSDDRTSHAPTAADHHRRIGRRRQEHTDRPALHDTDSLPIDHLEAVTDEEGIADLAALSDGLRAEREQGITIDVAYRFFSTDTRSYILADTPGHERYTRNMFTGASNAHVAVLLVDARAGVLRQTNRHARIAKLLGIKHFVAAVNKIDLVDFDQARFNEVDDELSQVAARLGGIDITVIPIAAKLGDNVVHRSDRTPWYDGPTLLEYLEGVELSAPQPETDKLRLPVQWVSRPTADAAPSLHRPAVGGHTEGRRSDRQPASGTRSTVTVVDTLDDERHDRRCATVGFDRVGRRHRRRPRRRLRQWRRRRVPSRCSRANSTRRCAGSRHARCGPATGSRSSRAPARFAPPCRRSTPGWTRRRSTNSTTRSSWYSTTSAK